LLFEHIILFFVSFIANCLSAIAGGGAGLLQLPILLFLGLSFSTALATHKIASIALGVGATLRYLKEEPLERQLAVFILLAGLPGVIFGAVVILSIPDELAKLSLGVLTMGLGVYSWSKKTLGQTAYLKNRSMKGFVIGGLVLFIIGFLNGSLTSGTGLFVTLWLIHWFGLDYKRAVTYTLILVGLFWNATGAITLALKAPVYWQWLPVLLAGSMLGGYLGAHLSIMKGNKVIKRVFEALTLCIGFKLIFDAIPVVLLT